MSEQATEDVIETTLQERVDLYAFLGKSLRDELDAADLAMLAAEPTTARDVEDADPLDGSDLLKTFREDLGDLDEAETEERIEELAASFGRLFHMDTGVSVDPYESVYRNGGKLYQESYTKVKKTMDELEYDGYEGHPEPADHVAFELDFMAYLGRGALEEYREDNREYADRYLNLQAEFLETHLGQWAPRLCDSIAENADSAFYEAVARITKSLVESDPETIETIRAELNRD